MSVEEKSVQPSAGRAPARLLIGMAIGLLLVWLSLGVLPASLALWHAYGEISREGKPFDWNARLGTFGDSFAGTSALISSLSLLAVAYQLVQDRAQKARDERAQEERKKQQDEIALLAVLIEARVSLHNSVARNQRLQTEELNKQDFSGLRRRKVQENVRVLNRTGAINTNELNRMMKRAEELIGWQIEKIDVDEPFPTEWSSQE